MKYELYDPATGTVQQTITRSPTMVWQWAAGTLDADRTDIHRGDPGFGAWLEDLTLPTPPDGLAARLVED